MRRQSRHQRRRNRHDDHRELERPLAPQAIAEMAEQDPADRAHEIADGEDAEGVDEARQRVRRGKEARADDRREEGEHDEVVPLEQVADIAGRDGPEVEPLVTTFHARQHTASRRRRRPVSASALHCPGHGRGAHEGHGCRDRGRRHRGRIRGAPPRAARPPRHGARAGRDRLRRVGRQCGHDRLDRLGPCAGSARPPHRGQPRPVQGDGARSWRGHRAPAVGLAPGHPHRGAARLRARPRGGAPRARACDRAARHPRRPEPRARPEPGAPRRRLLAAALPGRSRAGHAGLRAGRRADRAPASSPITK